jgi:hypothetical protein
LCFDVDSKTPFEPPKRLLAVLSVTLKQRDLRLYFVHRLLRAYRAYRALNNGEPWATRDYGKTIPLEGIGGQFRKNDAILLGEGWGDIVILFGWPVDESGKTNDEQALLLGRMRGAFEVEHALFQDFQVDRTELSLVPDCFQAASADPDFAVTMQVRLLEDRQLAFTSSDFERRASGELNKLTNGEGFIAHTPGSRMNFCLCRVEKKDGARPGVKYRDVIEKVVYGVSEWSAKQHQVDILETTITRLPSTNRIKPLKLKLRQAALKGPHPFCRRHARSSCQSGRTKSARSLRQPRS